MPQTSTTETAEEGKLGRFFDNTSVVFGEANISRESQPGTFFPTVPRFSASVSSLPASPASPDSPDASRSSVLMTIVGLIISAIGIFLAMDYIDEKGTNGFTYL